MTRMDGIYRIIQGNSPGKTRHFTGSRGRNSRCSRVVVVSKTEVTSPRKV